MSQIENHVLYNVIMLKIIINENKRQVGYCVVFCSQNMYWFIRYPVYNEGTLNAIFILCKNVVLEKNKSVMNPVHTTKHWPFCVLVFFSYLRLIERRKSQLSRNIYGNEFI